jgi:hypothetical protein
MRPGALPYVSVYVPTYPPPARRRVTAPQPSPSQRPPRSGAAAAVGTLAAAGAAQGADEKRRPTSAADQVTLGRTGLKTSLLGMGTGSVGVGHSSNQVKLGEAGFVKLVRYAFDKGKSYSKYVSSNFPAANAAARLPTFASAATSPSLSPTVPTRRPSCGRLD